MTRDSGDEPPHEHGHLHAVPDDKTADDKTADDKTAGNEIADDKTAGRELAGTDTSSSSVFDMTAVRPVRRSRRPGSGARSDIGDSTDGLRRIAWFHCHTGIAGDMALASLLDAGADFDQVHELLQQLAVPDWQIEAEPVLRGGIAATRVHVHVADNSSVVRTASHIMGLVRDAGLPEPVSRRALATFQALAEVEGRLHRRPPEQVHFHEVGGVDAIVDVVGTCAALWLLGIDDVQSSPVANGTGVVRAAHGLLPNPVPAVVDLLAGAPTFGVDLPFELTTPTGAALLAASVSRWGPLPPMTVEASGFGAGSRDFDDRPNAVQVIIGRASDTAGRGDAEGGGTRFGRPGQPVMLFEANVDDTTGEILAHTVAQLLEAGAHDAWVTPTVMKKGRPAHVVSALVSAAEADVVAATLAAETGTLGLRGVEYERWPLARDADVVDVDGFSIRVKRRDDRVKVEHDDAAAAARALGRPLRDVLADAQQAAASAADSSVPEERNRRGQ